MTSQGLPRPVRRSPLESVHVGLDARWVGDADRWPASYGDPEAEAAAVAGRAGLADIGPLDKIVVRGPRTPIALATIGIAPIVGSVVTSDGDGTEAWCLADDEVLVLRPAPMGELAGRIRAGGAAVADIGSGLSVLRLVGPASVAVLERACPVDLSARAIPNHRIAQAPVAGVRSVIARQDHPVATGYTLLIARDLAEYLWGALLDLGNDLGLTPVGGTVAAGTRS